MFNSLIKRRVLAQPNSWIGPLLASRGFAQSPVQSVPANHAPGRCYMSPRSLLLEAATWEVPRNSWPHLLPCLSSKLCLQFSPSQTKGWDPREKENWVARDPLLAWLFVPELYGPAWHQRACAPRGTIQACCSFPCQLSFFFSPRLCPYFLQFSPSTVWLLLISSFTAKIQFLVPVKLVEVSKVSWAFPS